MYIAIQHTLRSLHVNFPIPCQLELRTKWLSGEQRPEQCSRTGKGMISSVDRDIVVALSPRYNSVVRLRANTWLLETENSRLDGGGALIRSPVSERT
jgi:hypothetical protein